MAGAHVRFLAVSTAAEGQPYGAISDRAGHFSITSLPAGTYIVEAQQRGFFYLPPKGGGAVPRVSLKAGQQLTDFKIEMAQGATISGRVMDDNGDPVEAGVHAEPEAQRAMNYGRFGSTDERGEFNISVAPGKYYIVAEPGNRSQEQEIRTDGTVAAKYGKTYYPSSAAQAKAVIVEAVAGAELTGIDIHVVRQSRGLSISGLVTGGAETIGSSMVWLQQGDDPRQTNMAGTTGTGRSDHFLFADLQPGTYRLFALHSSDKTRLYSQPVDVHLESGDVTGVNLVLSPGGEMTGRLEMSGSAGTEKLSVSLVTTINFFGESAPSAEVDPSGAFRIGNIAPGRYRVKVAPIPENAYLKSVRLDGVEALDGDLDLSRGAQGSSLRIVVSRNGGQVSGKLLDQSGEPVGVVPVMVLLVADPKDIDLERSLKMAEDGTYRFQGIRPGKYRLLAVDRFLFGDGSERLEAVKKLAAAAEEIEIKEGDRKVKDLKLVKEDADAKPGQ